MPRPSDNTKAISSICHAAQPLAYDEGDYDSLLDQIGDARLVLIGEASHGTHDFYRERARITRRLIAEKRFAGVAAEADWPDAYRLNCFVQGEGSDRDAREALGDFLRFPAWMWRNMDVLDFADWLRSFNARSSGSATDGNARKPAGFFGLDLYSMYTSARAVLRYLDANDPAAADRARYRYRCLEHFGEDTQAYGYAASFGMTESCEQGIIEQLMELQSRPRDGSDLFSAQQNARIVRDAEKYYRAMFGRRVNSWNIRDCHMAETLDHLLEHLGPESRLVVWAHNSHLGDARATQMGRAGELNVGQLVRERYGSAAFLLGMTTYSGEVTAATNWDQPAERKSIRPGLPGSIETLFHETDLGDFILSLREPEIRSVLAAPRLERAIGVIYRPETERVSHYFEARIADQFDAVLHIDRTQALIPLEKSVPEETADAPETFPFAV